MIDFTEYFNSLKQISPEFAAKLQEVTNMATANTKNADLDKWQRAINTLPTIQPTVIDLNTNAVQIGSSADCDDRARAALKSTLMNLHPWRKGPFNLFGQQIETEWRCDMKWARIKDAVGSLEDKLVLDIGSGNGYYALRMLGQGAKAVVAIDPMLLFVIQFKALNKYIKSESAAVLPLKLEDMPDAENVFDSIFSMGVLYHRKEPVEHLEHIYKLLKPNGQIILETLIIESENDDLLEPAGRYAKMRNVYKIPSPSLLKKWVEQAGFSDAKIIDITKTTSSEQRKTEWMTFESLEDYLDPADNTKTIEGHPAPVRAFIIANK